MDLEIDKKYIVVLTEEFARIHDDLFLREYEYDGPPLIGRREQIVIATHCDTCKAGFDLDFVNKYSIYYAGLLGDEYLGSIESIIPEIDENDIRFW